MTDTPVRALTEVKRLSDALSTAIDVALDWIRSELDSEQEAEEVDDDRVNTLQDLEATLDGASITLSDLSEINLTP